MGMGQETSHTSVFWNSSSREELPKSDPARRANGAQLQRKLEASQKHFPVTCPLSPVTFPRYSRHFQKREPGKPIEGNGFCYPDTQNKIHGRCKSTRNQYNVHILSRI